MLNFQKRKDCRSQKRWLPLGCVSGARAVGFTPNLRLLGHFGSRMLSSAVVRVQHGKRCCASLQDSELCVTPPLHFISAAGAV